MPDDTQGARPDPDATVKMAQVAGKTFFGGRFQLIEPIGQGAFGVVWKAHDSSLNNAVALKFLPDIVRLDDEALKDMVEETRRSLLLTHPHIVRVFDLHQDSEAAAIAMELVEGKSLSSAKSAREESYFEVEEIAAWVQQVCEALRYAHEKARVVHRDIKPQNVLLDANGEAKVCDFGISRSVSDTMTRLTGEVTSFTPAYGSPEQAMGAGPDERQDVYAVGAMIYDLLTGRPPFFRGDVLAQLREIVPPPMVERRRELGFEGKPIPYRWEQTVAACLKKDPAERPQTIAELEAMLFGDGNVPATKGKLRASAGEKKGSPLVAVLGVGVILAVVSVLGWKFLSPMVQDGWGPVSEVASGSATAGAKPESAVSVRPGQNFVLEDIQMEMIWIPPLEAWVGKSEVTQKQYALGGGIGMTKYEGSERAHDSVTWNQAMEFCRNLTAREASEGRLPQGYVYTLPTEHQWEIFVADATLENAVYGGKESDGPSEPGTKPPNLFGLVDVRGNLWEWTLDDHTPGNSSKGKTLRGGSFVTDGKMVMDSGARFYGTEDNAFWQYGFRLVLTQEDAS